MIKRFQRNKKKVEPYLKIIDTRWDSQLRKNLHAAGFWLNPACQYNEQEMERHNSTTSGLLDVIEKYAYGDGALQSKLTNEMRLFKKAEQDFGRKPAKNDRTLMMPDQWWDTYGCSAPHLQKLAIRVLSQTCSASGCERNWSVFEHIHSKKRNRLEHQRLNDIVYVHYNLRLQQRSRLKLQSYDPISFEAFDDDHSNWVLEDSPPILTIDELEVLRREDTNLPTPPNLDDFGQLNLDDDDDDDDGGGGGETNVAENEDNALGVEEMGHEFSPSLTPWI